MKGLYLVEPVTALYAFSSFLTFPLEQQYVYRVLWVQLTNSSYPSSDDSSRCATNSSSNQTVNHEVRHAAFDIEGTYVRSLKDIVIITSFI